MLRCRRILKGIVRLNTSNPSPLVPPRCVYTVSVMHSSRSCEKHRPRVQQLNLPAIRYAELPSPQTIDHLSIRLLLKMEHPVFAKTTDTLLVATDNFFNNLVPLSLMKSQSLTAILKEQHKNQKKNSK